MKSYNITQIPFETGRLELCAKQPFIKIYSHVHWLSNSHNSKPVFLEILLDICMYMKERHLFQFDYFQKSLNFLRVSYFMTMTVFLETFSFCNALWYLIAKEIEWTNFYPRDARLLRQSWCPCPSNTRPNCSKKKQASK